MTQADWLLLAFKIVTIAGFASLTTWIVIYTRLYPWWRNPIGRTLVAKTAVIALLLIPTALSLFFHLSRQNSEIAGWADVILLGSVTPIMLWRSAVWLRLHRDGTTGTLPAGEKTKELPLLWSSGIGSMVQRVHVAGPCAPAQRAALPDL